MRRPLVILAALLVLAGTASAADAASQAPAALPPVPASQATVTLYGPHTVYASPQHGAARVTTVAEVRPLTGVQTVLPVIRTQQVGAQRWLLVRLPGRPNGRSGWISAQTAEIGTTPWAIVVQIDLRRVLVYDKGRRVRTFSAIVGKAATPTPHGRFFVEETVRMDPLAPGAPWALATSARSDALEHYEGGVGQIALHGIHNLTGRMGTAASHGCVRLGDTAIRYLAAHIGPGVPVSLRGR